MAGAPRGLGELLRDGPSPARGRGPFCSEFRAFVFDAYARRITDLFLLLDEVAFQRIDVRLAQKLLDLARGGDSIAATHQQLAAELGTAREVVSRQLQEFRRRGLVAAARGETLIRDRAGLKALADSA